MNLRKPTKDKWWKISHTVSDKWSYIETYCTLEHLILGWISCPESHLLLQGNRLNLDPGLIIWWDNSFQTWLCQDQLESLLRHRWLDPNLRVWGESLRICILMVFEDIDSASLRPDLNDPLYGGKNMKQRRPGFTCSPLFSYLIP